MIFNQAFVILAGCTCYFASALVPSNEQYPIQVISEAPNGYTESFDHPFNTLDAVAGCWTGTRPAGDIVVADLPAVESLPCNGEEISSTAIKQAINQAGCCWAPGNGMGKYPNQACRCKDTGKIGTGNTYPHEFEGKDFALDGWPDYCRANGPTDYMEEFPVPRIIPGSNPAAPYCESIAGLYRVIYQATRGATGAWSLRYCGLVYHDTPKTFQKCKAKK